MGAFWRNEICCTTGWLAGVAGRLTGWLAGYAGWLCWLAKPGKTLQIFAKPLSPQ